MLFTLKKLKSTDPKFIDFTYICQALQYTNQTISKRNFIFGSKLACPNLASNHYPLGKSRATQITCQVSINTLPFTP